MAAQDDNLTNKHSPVNGTDDREAHSKFWIAVYTRPRSEKKVAAELARACIETYIPVQKQLRIWSDRKKYIEVPVIPLIVFAKVDTEQIIKIRIHHLVQRILTYPGERLPAAIPDIEINNLKRLLNQSEIPVDFKYGKYEANDLVIITAGNLKGVTGLVREADEDTSIIWISVNLLGGSIIRVKNSQIKKISEDREI